MIGKLDGEVEEIEKNYLLLKTNSGVSYLVYLSLPNLSSLKLSQKLTLYIHCHFRENEMSLFGFLNKQEQKIFNFLISVSGVGPKSALNILSSGPLDKVTLAIKNQNVHFFSQIPGVGKKTAQKILLELSGKFEAEFSLEKVSFSKDDKLLLDALLSLGFKKPEALAAIERADKEGSIEERISKTLKQLNNGK